MAFADAIMAVTKLAPGPSDESSRAQLAAWWSRLDRGWKAAAIGILIATVELVFSLP